MSSQYKIILCLCMYNKGHVKSIQWVKIAVLFLLCYAKTVPIYDFKLVWVVLHLSVKQCFKTMY